MKTEKNGQIKGKISRRRPILFYTIQQVIPNICTNFKILGTVVPEKSLTKNKVYTHTHTITEKTKIIYPLCTSYAGVINICCGYSILMSTHNVFIEKCPNLFINYHQIPSLPVSLHYICMIND